MVTAKDIPIERLALLADAHIRLYERRVAMGEAGARGIVTDECRAYLELWRDTKAKLLELGMAGLDSSQLGEIQDAIECGDYDRLLGLEG